MLVMFGPSPEELGSLSTGDIIRFRGAEKTVRVTALLAEIWLGVEWVALGDLSWCKPCVLEEKLTSDTNRVEMGSLYTIEGVQPSIHTHQRTPPSIRLGDDLNPS